jgi:hypothetical protein
MKLIKSNDGSGEAVFLTRNGEKLMPCPHTPPVTVIVRTSQLAPPEPQTIIRHCGDWCPLFQPDDDGKRLHLLCAHAEIKLQSDDKKKGLFSI